VKLSFASSCTRNPFFVTLPSFQKMQLLDHTSRKPVRCYGDTVNRKYIFTYLSLYVDQTICMGASTDVIGEWKGIEPPASQPFVE
jgi:hypothetical protein